MKFLDTFTWTEGDKQKVAYCSPTCVLVCYASFLLFSLDRRFAICLNVNAKWKGPAITTAVLAAGPNVRLYRDIIIVITYGTEETRHVDEYLFVRVYRRRGCNINFVFFNSPPNEKKTAADCGHSRVQANTLPPTYIPDNFCFFLFSFLRNSNELNSNLPAVNVITKAKSKHSTRYGNEFERGVRKNGVLRCNQSCCNNKHNNLRPPRHFCVKHTHTHCTRSLPKWKCLPPQHTSRNSKGVIRFYNFYTQGLWSYPKRNQTVWKKKTNARRNHKKGLNDPIETVSDGQLSFQQPETFPVALSGNFFLSERVRSSLR